MTENQRLKIIMKELGFRTQKDFAAALNVQQGSLSDILREKEGVGVSNNIGDKLEFLFNVRKEWLYDGEGSRFLDGGKTEQKHSNPSINSEKKGVPYYDIDFVGGFDLVFNNNQVNPTFYIDFLPFNDADYWVNVSGKSMGPLIAHGDLVALKKVEGWQDFLLEGEIYAIITNNGFRTIKMIGAGKDDDHYTLIPYNKGADYANQSIPKKVITHVFRVKGAIKKFF